MRRNRAAFDRVELRPTAFGQVAEPEVRTSILGRPAAAPIVLAPTGYTRLSHHTGERAVAAAAAAAGLPYTLSTYATTSITDVARRGTAGTQLVPGLPDEGPRGDPRPHHRGGLAGL